MQTDVNAPPLNPLPWIVWALALPMIGVEAVVSLAERGLLGDLGWRLEAVQLFAYAPELLRYFWDNGIWRLDGLHRLLSYAFVHVSLLNAVFAVVMLLALGKMVAEVFRWWAVLAVFFGAAAGGALVYTLVLPRVETPLIGAFPAVYGLIGAYTFLLWVRAVGTGTSQARAFRLIGALLVFQLIFGVLFGGGYAWVAEVAGFFAGFGLSFLVVPGGWARIRDRLRAR